MRITPHSSVAARWLAAAVVGAAALLTGCGGKLESRWCDRTVTIDGIDDEWDDARVLLDDASIGLGLLNDDRCFYLTLSLTDPSDQRQAMMQGLTVWLDGRGGKRQTFGVRFPVGGAQGVGGRPDRRPDGEAGTDDAPRQRMAVEERLGMERQNAEQVHRLYGRLAASRELLVLGPGKGEERRMRLDNGGDIGLRTSYDRGRLVYELRVPLASTYEMPWGIGARPGRTIGVGVETPKTDLSQLMQRRGGGRGGVGGMPPGGMDGGMRGGMGGGRGGGMGPRGGMGQMPEPLKVWCKVQLATAPAAVAR